MPGIDRRLTRDVFTFCLIDRQYFDTNYQYKPDDTTSYKTYLVDYLDEHWDISKMGIWYSCFPVPRIPLPEQGFKIHVSATARNASNILEHVIPVLAREKVAFKVVVDAFMLNFMNSKASNRGSSGKFITIYPRNDNHFKELLCILHESTKGMEGPYILSDKRYDTSKVLFYRYGGFIAHYTLNIFGEEQFILRDPSGQLVDDQRTPFFHLPSWVEDPFVSPLEEAASATVILGERYVVEQPISFSNTGGVYRGLDQQTEETVLIKEARPHIGETQHEHTGATVLLQREYLILERLQDTGYTPRPLAFVQEWEHFFLIEEYIQGENLTSFRAWPDVALLLQESSPDNIQKFYHHFIQIGRNLINAIQAIHQCSVLVVDISTNNILIDPETLKIHFIDLEGALFFTESIPVEAMLITPGFASPERLRGNKPTINDDYYALGCVLYSILIPIQSGFTLNPLGKLAFLERITQDIGLPSIIQQIILGLLEGRIQESIDLLFQDHTYPNIYNLSTTYTNRDIQADQLESMCTNIDSYILQTATPDRNDRLWPADYRVFTTNPLNMAYGALGILLYLHNRDILIPDQYIDWVLHQKIDTQIYTPGLFVGSSGIAWGLAELGLLEEAEHIIQQAYQSPLLYNGNDIFYGTAGWGLTSLYFYTKTQNSLYLEQACAAGNHLIGQANREGKVCQWQAPDGEIYHSFAHGASGIALFLLYLYQYTKHQLYLDYAVAGMEYEISQAIKEGNSIVWQQTPDSALLSPYWRFGNAGIGSVLLRFARILQDNRYTELAICAANYIAPIKFAVFPGQFVGMSGIGEFLIDMYLSTSELQYLQQAHTLAANVALFGVEQPSGLAFLGDELLRLSNDYGTGAAGIGMFLNRLQEPKEHFLYDFDAKLYPSAKQVTT